MVTSLSCTLSLVCAIAVATPQIHHLPSLREQAAIQDGWREERLANIPAILQKHGVDAWLVSSMQEYRVDSHAEKHRSLKSNMAKTRHSGP